MAPLFPHWTHSSVRRLALVFCLSALGVGVAAPGAPAKTTFTVTGDAVCEQFIDASGVITTVVGVRGSITPIPQTEFDISIVSDLQGEVAHFTLPAGFDVSGFTAFIGSPPLGVITTTVFQDLNGNDIQDPGEPVFGSNTVRSPCDPPPKSKQECKHGGWRTFSAFGFKNQGDCVSFVATGGSNPPAGSRNP